MLNVAAQRSDIEMIIRMGNLDEVIQAVKSYSDTGIDAIISRGGTAQRIRAEFSIPVSEIFISVLDVLRAVRLAQSFTDNFAVAGFPAITKPASVLCDLMQFDIKIADIHNASETEACVDSLKKQGYTLVVGDTAAVNAAKRLGIKSILVTSGIESVEAAIENAVQLHRYYSDVRGSLNLLSDVLSNIQKEVIVLDSSGRQCFSTVKELPPSLEPVLRTSVPSVIAEEPMKLLRRIDTQMISVEGSYLQSSGKDYCMYSLAKRPYVKGFLDQVIKYLGPEDDVASWPFENFLGESEKIKDMIETMNRYAALDQPVLLLGEIGTGKDRFAHYIYKHGRLKTHSFVQIDCSMMSEKHWKFLLEDSNSPMYDSGLTIYLNRLGSATLEQRILLKTFLKSSSSFKLNRLFFSFTLGSNFNEHDELYLYLIESLSCLILHIPPLRKRQTDIPILAGLYVNALNISLGTQVLGFTPDAMLILQNFSWERNIDQLMRIVRELVITARTSYISATSVQSVLVRERDRKYISNQTSINLNGSLDKIMREVVRAIFEEEKGNQTKTAKRLGISRSTLWRMLKQDLNS